MAKLTTEARKKIAPKNFALPGGRYPINDPNHARNALARVSEFGSPEEKSEVRSKVHAKYPTIGKMAGGGSVWNKVACAAGGMDVPDDDSDDSSDTDTDSNSGEMTQSPMASPDAKTALMNYLQGQGSGQQNLQALADLYKQQLASQNNREDYSGLLNLVDSSAGTDLGKSYKRPLTPAEQTQAVMSAEEGVQKSGQPIAQDLLKEQGNENVARKIAAAQYNPQKFEKQSIDLLNKHQGFLNTDKLYSTALTKQNDMNEIQGLAEQAQVDQASGNANGLAKNLLPIKLIPAITGLKRVNTQELNAAAGSDDWVKSANRWKEKISTGGMTPEDYDNLNKVIGTARKAADAELSDRAKYHINQYKAGLNHLGIKAHDDEAAQDLGLGRVGVAPTTSNPAPLSNGSVKMVFPDGRMKQVPSDKAQYFSTKYGGKVTQ